MIPKRNDGLGGARLALSPAPFPTCRKFSLEPWHLIRPPTLPRRWNTAEACEGGGSETGKHKYLPPAKVVARRGEGWTGDIAHPVRGSMRARSACGEANVQQFKIVCSPSRNGRQGNGRMQDTCIAAKASCMAAPGLRLS